MGSRPFDLIGFDADDTLWHNERHYREARDRFRELLSRAGADLTDEALDTRVNDIEVANLEYFGYGVSNFALSLIEAAIGITDGRIQSADLREVIDLARDMLREKVELFTGAEEALAALAPAYPLILVTKGDLLHQTSKLERSGLQRYFRHVEVVSHKTPETYARILARHGVEPRRFLMVGNSLRSDVLPVIATGASAVYVPAAITWAHEHADVPRGAGGRFFEVVTLHELAPLVESLAGRPPK